MEMSKDCEDFGIDFPHAPPACPACFDKELEARARQLQEELLRETKRSNDLKERELMEGNGGGARTPPPHAPSYTPRKTQGRGVIPIDD